jgi:phospholipid/cholesterol/gamma-HCH transport system substrate-binding protein
MTKEKKKILKTGILFVIVILITIWGVSYIRSNDIITGKTRLFAVYDDVKELSEGNHVYLNGTKIGKVAKVDFFKGNLNKLIVEFHIRKDIRIPDSSIAMIASIDIMGTKGLKIILNNNTKTFHQSGDTLLSDVESSISEEVNKQILPLKLKTESMIGTLDSLLVAFRAVFNPDTRSNIKRSFEHIQITLQNLESTSSRLDTLMRSEKKRISDILKNAESITTNLENNNETITKILTNFGDISDSLASANFVDVIYQAENTIARLGDILDKVEKGEGSLGLLINDKVLYDKLAKTSHDLDELLLDVKKNPKRYVRFSAFSIGKRIIINSKDSIDVDD